MLPSNVLYLCYTSIFLFKTTGLGKSPGIRGDEKFLDFFVCAASSATSPPEEIENILYWD